MTKLSEIEKKYVRGKEWMHRGETNAFDRPKNSLLNCDFEFKQAKTVSKQSEDEELEIKLLVKERVKEKKFDNIEFRAETNEENEIAQEIVPTGNGTVLSCEEIEDLLNVLNVELMKISDLNNNICEYKSSNPTKKPKDRPNSAQKNKESAIKELKKHKNVKIIK